MKRHLLILLAVALTLVGNLRATPAAATQPVTIQMCSQHAAVELAATELVRYLNQMAGRGDAVVVADGSSKASIRVGLLADCGVTFPGLADPSRDDAVHVDVRGSRGVIAGSNPRSVLFAAYRFLEACGCRWIRPGKDGDFVPSRPVDNLTARLADKAAYRFRGNNNCGTYSLDQILDKIAWAPKVGLNTFFSEFLLPRFLYNDYYSHKYPSLRQSEPRSDEEIRAYHELTIRELKRRGLSYHAAGHGWTGLVLGNPESESDHRSTLVVPPGKEHYLALVGGKRPNNGPTFTDLCYSNPEVQRLLVRCIVDYAVQHPEVDYLHVWQDDSMNRTCECERCRTMRVSDWYLRILNQLDAELTRRKIGMKIVFLIYQDLFWFPEKERFTNPARFVMMYAPPRKYSTPYYVGPQAAELPAYQLNKNERPTDEPVAAGFLRGWQRLSPSEAFVFDYHMTWHHYLDPGYYGFLDVMAEDIRRLPRMGMQGFVSCQVLRSYFPHGYPMYAHARLLWNPGENTDALARSYFAGSFGDGSEQVRHYMAKLSELFARVSLDRETLVLGKDLAAKQPALAKLAQVEPTVAAFRPVIEAHLSAADPAQRLSWKYLAVHADLVVRLAAAVQGRALGGGKGAEPAWRQLVEELAAREADTDPALDIHWFVNTCQSRLGFPRVWTPRR